MKKLHAAAISALVASTIAFSQAALAKDELMLGYADPEDSIFGKAATVFADTLKDVSGGKMTVSLFPNGTLGAINEMPAMLQQGSCDATIIVSSALVDLVPEMGVFDLPFLFASYGDAQKAVEGEVGAKLAQKIEEQGMHHEGWMTMGFREVTSNKEIKSLADFKGLKIRTQSNEVHQDIFKALGAAPTVINFSELYTALEQGTVDAEENPYVNIYNNTYYEVQKYLVETNHVFQVAGLVFSKDTYDGLSDEQKSWVGQAAKAAVKAEWEATKQDNAKARDGAIAEGMKAVTLDHQALVDATKGVYDKYRSKYVDLLQLLGR